MDSETSNSKEEHKNLPSVTSSDPNERKLARRMRIQARLEAAERAQAIIDGTYVEPEPEQPLLLETIETSDDTLRQLYQEGRELVSNIIVASDAKEVVRRETEAKNKSERLERLEEESALALQKLDEISRKWETILDINGPLELFQNMKEQKAKCLDLIEQKNNLIKNFQMELKLADEKYMKGRKSMYEELSLLTKRIDEQVLLMRRAYRIELNKIEDSVDVTRAEITEKHEKMWRNLYNQREKEETMNMSKKFALVESFHEEFDKLHVDHEERFRGTRIQLETDIQILEQELEQVKALCLLNSEKLDYNYQVLKKREEENVYIKNHQKRRLNKLQDVVNSLKKKIDEKSQATEEEYKRLTKDVSRYYANVLETEKKAELFSEINDEKFNSIWNMKEEEAKDLLKKIFSVDMIVHEQILGVEWTPPGNLDFKKTDLPSFKTALSVVEDYSKKKKGGVRKSISTPEKLFLGDTDSPEFLEGHKRLLCHILELVADQSGFLMEQKLDELLLPYTEGEKTFVRLDNVFVAIGVTRESDIEAMKEIFLPYSMCLLCDRNTKSAVSLDRGAESSVGVRQPESRPPSILHIHELEEKVSKLRIQAKAESNEAMEISGKEEVTFSQERKLRMSVDRRERERERERGRESPPYPYKVGGGEGAGLGLEESGGAGAGGGEGQPGPQGMERVESRGTTEEEGKGKMKCNISHPLIIEKFNVLRALKDFVSFYHAGRLKVMLGIEEKLNPKRFTISRLLSREDIMTYWEKYSEAIPSRLEGVWDGVFNALKRYLTVLQHRHKLNKKAKSLIRQNQELKRLVYHYNAFDNCENLKLPEISSVPDEPIDPVELSNILNKLYV